MIPTSFSWPAAAIAASTLPLISGKGSARISSALSIEMTNSLDLTEGGLGGGGAARVGGGVAEEGEEEMAEAYVVGAFGVNEARSASSSSLNAFKDASSWSPDTRKSSRESRDAKALA
ncbi:hypothetical protein K438DRAFT_1759804 [Mycena galopus ATCC 62051]|nr:hypothetical protein K438DRAFT_1759804 [Mycena galopus ATCC 62051]